MVGTRGRPDRAAFDRELERLYREAGPRLWRALYGFAGGRRQLAEDAMAEAFARALEYGDRVRDPLPWLYRTAFRIAAGELRSERRNPPVPPEPVPGVDPDDIREVLVALRALSPNQRAAVSLCDQEGVPAVEAAPLLGMAAATVRVHLFRGRRRMRELLKDRGEEG